MAAKFWSKASFVMSACALTVGLAALLIAVRSAAYKRPAILSVRGLQVTDDAGRVRAALLVRSDDEPTFTLYDKSGAVIVDLLIEPTHTGSLAFYGSKGQILCRLQALDKASGLTFYGENGRCRAAVGFVFGSPHMSLYRAKGGLAGTFDEIDGRVALKLHDASKVCRATLGSTDLVTIATGDVHERTASSLVLFDKNGTVIHRVP